MCRVSPSKSKSRSANNGSITFGESPNVAKGIYQDISGLGGPFITIQGRGKRREKQHLCLFTCLATRAIHLEIAYGLSTDSFLNAFYRIASRRGLPDEVYSDNGTNFVGADRELQALLAQVESHKIKESVANKGVKLHLNPPLAPHFGGAHESMVKSAKKAIKAILGQGDINNEELMTAIVGAEGLINSRPLTYPSANHADDVPLTPNHFLHGQIGGQFAPMSVDETSVQSAETMEKSSRTGPTFLEKMAPGMAAGTQREKEVAPGKTKHTDGRGGSTHLVRYTAGKLALE